MNFFIILLLALDLKVHGYNNFISTNSVHDDGVKAIQPLCEYFDCPQIFFKTDCPECALTKEPVCAVEVITGAKKIFQNPCEVERTICTTKRAWNIVNIKECSGHILERILERFNNILQNREIPEVCPLEYRPVCARYMDLEEQFDNECELQNTIYRTQQTWHLIRRGPCQRPNLKAVGQHLAAERKCSNICPLEYKPICAKFHNEMRTFENKCELDNIICQYGYIWQIVKEGHCLESHVEMQVHACPEFCKNEYEPVCAKFGEKRKMFNNVCELEKAKCITNINWEMLNMGICFVDQLKKLVDNSCKNAILDPICAIYGYRTKTFENVCQLAKEIERSGNIWSILYKGTCSNATSSFPEENGSKDAALKWETTTNLRHTITTQPESANVHKFREEEKS